MFSSQSIFLMMRLIRARNIVLPTPTATGLISLWTFSPWVPQLGAWVVKDNPQWHISSLKTAVATQLKLFKIIPSHSYIIFRWWMDSLKQDSRYPIKHPFPVRFSIRIIQLNFRVRESWFKIRISHRFASLVRIPMKIWIGSNPTWIKLMWAWVL